MVQEECLEVASVSLSLKEDGLLMIQPILLSYSDVNYNFGL